MKASEIETTRLAQAAAPSAGDDALIVPASGSRRELDLGRDVHALLGLVFDRIDLAGATRHLRRCVEQRRRCFLSTPNVNFVAGAARDDAFRDSVLRSDLSVADGFPIVRVARWMGVDMPGRVAGADLFERLHAQGRSAERPPIRLYLFGGPPGVGERAAAQLNAQAGGFECVGHDEGGFGDIEAMSSAATIERINASGADFVLVALGAKKGQAWIERNRARLHAPVFSHLGAVINFAAGSVARSPAWVQRFGLEWAWRVLQEPALWRRYWNDGQLLASTLALRIVPWWLRQRLARLPASAQEAPRFEIIEDDAGSASCFKLWGDWRNGADLLPLRRALAQRLRTGRTVQIDLAESPAVGSALLGLAALIDAWQVGPRALRAGSVRDRVLLADIRAHGAQHLLAQNQ